MPPIETACRYDKAVYWAKSGKDKYARPTLAAAADLDVRWEHVQEETVDSQGNTIAVDAILVLDQSVVVGSIFWEGEIDDIPGTSQVPSSDLFQCIKFSRIPDIKGRHVRRLAYLRKYSDDLPDLD